VLGHTPLLLNIKIHNATVIIFPLSALSGNILLKGIQWSGDIPQYPPKDAYDLITPPSPAVLVYRRALKGIDDM
jgi:hypothetical protein